MSNGIDSSFNGKISSCIDLALKTNLGENGLILIEHMIIGEIKHSFGIELREGATLAQAMNEACKVYCNPRSLCCPPGETCIQISDRT